jgi:voltage-gated potassium channel
MNRTRLNEIADALEWPIALLALLVVPALVLDDRTTSPELHVLAEAVNWVVWGAFCLEFAIRWSADRSGTFFRKAWFDLLLIVVSPPFLVPDYLQATRSLRAIRILRLLRLIRAGMVAGIGLRLSRRLFGHRRFHYVALVAVVIVFLGALGIFTLERGQNPAIRSFGDSLWWAVVTSTTVGYGDVSPVTTEGRLIAVVLMLTGIGVIGVFTATLASFFFEHDRNPQLTEVTARLEAIERKLEQLLAKGEDTLR